MRVRFGGLSLVAGAFPLVVLVGMTRAIWEPGVFDVSSVVGSLVVFIVLSPFFRLWFRLCLRVDYPVLEVGQWRGVAKFDLRDPDVLIEIREGLLEVSQASDGRRVRCHGANAENRGFSVNSQMESLASELDELLRGQGGARLVYEPPLTPRERHRQHLEKWRDYRRGSL